MRAGLTINGVETNFPIIVTIFFTSQMPTPAHFSPGAGQCLHLPINDKITDIKAFARVGLSITPATCRPDQVDIVTATFKQVVNRDVGCIDQMLIGQ